MDKNTEQQTGKAGILAEAKDFYRRASEASSQNHENWLDDVRFARLNQQWPEEVKRQRELEGRPCLTINKLPAFIRQVTNDARQNKPAIKVHPVGDGADQETAEIENGLIRNIEYASNADVAYDTALDHAVTGGFGYMRVLVDYACNDVFEKDILIERVANPLTVLEDPRSTAADSSDWMEAMVTDMWPKEDFKKKYPNAEIVDWEGEKDQKTLEWFRDDMVRVGEYWKREEVEATLYKLSNGQAMMEEQYANAKELLDTQGVTIVEERPTKTYKVTQYIVSGAEVLEENKWAGQYIPIIPVYGDEVMVEGERHWISLVRFAKDPQRMFNYWRTASTELVALAPKTPYIGAKGSFNTDAAKWQSANTATHAYIEYDQVNGAAPPQRQPFAGPPAGALQESLNASDDMKSIMGIYDASLGARSNETSGRAIMARQREGDVSTFNYIDNLSRGIRHLGRILVDMIPRVYNAPRVIRIINEDGSNKQVQINAPFTPQTPEQMQDEMEQVQGITKLYDLTTGKYDVTCEVGPSYTTKREEAAAQMSEMVRAFPQLMQVAGDLLVKNLDWPGADDLAKRLKAMLPPQAQGANPQAQALQQQLQQQDQMAKEAVGQLSQEIKDLQAKLADKEAERVMKEQELKIKAREVTIKEDEAKVRSITEMAQLGIPPEMTAQALAASKPKRKRARAAKQPDGSYMLESIEEVAE